MFETFHQSANGDFKPTFYNPFEIKHRRRTTKAQYRVLEAAFQENNKPNAGARRVLAAKLSMTPRAVQVWFQNRRAKCKSGKGPHPHLHHPSADSPDASPTMSPPRKNIEAPSRPERTRSCSSSTGAGPGATGRNVPFVLASGGGNSLARRHSMPDMQPIIAHGNLPFRELHEAIFGKSQPSTNPGGVHGHGHGHGHSHGHASLFPDFSAPQLTAAPTSIMPHPNPALQRKHPLCSASFMNSFLNVSLDTFGMNASLGPSNPTHYDPMISGDASNRIITGVTPGSAKILGELATPSISAPGSSPNLGPDDLFNLQCAIRSGQPPNPAILDAMANRLSTSLSPMELEMLLQSASPGKKDSTMDYFAGTAPPNDLVGLLFPSPPNDHGSGMNPMELLSCLPHPSDQFLYPMNYTDEALESSFS